MKTLTKKILALGLTATMAAGFATACTSEPSETSVSADAGVTQGVSLGGWQVENKAITEEQAAFDKAMETITGVNYEPFVLLASQVVSGTNYCYLCKATVVTPDAKPTYKLVYVYEDTAGNAEVLNIADLALPGYTDGEAVGGWSYADSPAITDEIEGIMDAVTGNLLGASYEPVAVIGTQVVSGTNYAILCAITTVTENPVTNFEMVYVYENLEGNCEITSTEAVDIAGLAVAN